MTTNKAPHDACGTYQLYLSPKDDSFLCEAGNFCYPIDSIVIPNLYNTNAEGLINDGHCKIVNSGLSLQCKCVLGQFCLENSTSPQFCPEGYFCPDPRQLPKPAEDGHFVQLSSLGAAAGAQQAMSGWYYQEKCAQTSGCPGYCNTINSNPFVIILVVVGVFVFFISYQLKLKMTSRKVKHKADGWERAVVKRLSLKVASGLGDDADAIAAPAADESGAAEGITISFKNISRTLSKKEGGKKILSSVSSAFPASTLTAVMGPSGAGKTSLLTTLMVGDFDEGGSVTVNGEEVMMNHFRSVMGFVPQEDVMIRELTVREIITFQADLRLPAKFTYAQRQERVNVAIHDLGLGNVENSRIGDENSRGISGGQRKRVNVAMEMVTMPRILILDEPTSGLDSTSSLALADSISNLVKRDAMTAVAVIHQPSAEAFAVFDNVILLIPGGKVMFAGPVKDLMPYFDNLGYSCPTKTNPADHALNMASGIALRTNASKPELTPAQICTEWAKAKGADPQSIEVEGESEGEGGSEGEGEESEALTNVKQCCLCLPKLILGIFVRMFEVVCRSSTLMRRELSCCLKKDDKREVPGFLTQVKLCFNRAVTQYYGSWYNVVVDMFVHLVMGLLVQGSLANFGFIGSYQESYCVTLDAQFTPTCIAAQYFPYVAGGGFSIWAAAFACMTSASQTFGLETSTYLREYKTGMNTFAYFLGKWLADIPRMMILASVFYGALVAEFANMETTGFFYLNYLLIYFWAWPFGYLIESWVGYRLTPLYSVIVALLMLVIFAGVNTTLLPDVADNLRWLYDIWGIRWAMQALVVGQLKGYEFGQDLDGNEVPWNDITSTLETYGYETPEMKRMFWNQFAIGVGTVAAAGVFRVFAFGKKKI